jgi:hypothetical protein
MSIQGLGTNLDLQVGGKKMQGAILETIEAIGLTLTVTGSSTITATAKDPDHLLVKAGWFGDVHDGRGAEAFLDGLPFVACAFKKKVDEFTLEFEDRDFWLMKEGEHARDPVKVYRGNKTLQEFVKEQCERLCGKRINFVCPQLKQVEPREPAQISSNTEGAKGEPAPGITGSFDIEGTPADAEQKKMANILLGECTGTPPVVAVSIICAALGESTLRNLTTPNSDGYWGVLQGGSGSSGSAPNFPKTPSDQTAKEMAECFVKGGRGFQGGGAAALARSGKTDPGEIATIVEDSGEPASYYGKFKAEAEAIIKAYGGNPGSSTSKTTRAITPEFFELNQKIGTEEEPEEEDETEENALSGIESLLKPGKWLFWKVGNTFYLYTEKELARLKAVVTLSESSKGILDIGYELDHSKKKVSKVIIECRALLWEVPPGQLVSFEDSVGEEISRDNEGKIRKWIVKNIERKDITDNATVVELILPESGKREKAQSIKELTVITPPIAPNPATGNHESQTDAKGKILQNSILFNVLFQMKWISQQRFPYVWDGGHNPQFAPSNEKGVVGRVGVEALGAEEGESEAETQAAIRRAASENASIGYDCSGALSSALHAGGIMANLAHFIGQYGKGQPGGSGYEYVGPQAAAWFKTYGEPGKGAWLTIWASDDHCFAEVHIPASMGSPNTEGPGLVVEGPPRASNSEPLFFVAKEKGTTVGFYSGETTEGFTARHWPGL